ncbi:MAG: FHA domain-containing protein [Proteobacteria bacterium]|nr:FHA domain-containing protein [Pseudomonadota bacterium]
MSAALKLEVFHNGELIQEVACEGKEIWVGRDEDCVIRLEDRAISRKHALLRPAATGVEFEKKSKFGSVRIGGRNVEHATLKGGEQLEFGDFEIRVHKIEAEKPAPDAVPETLSVMVTEPVVEQAPAALPEESGMEAAPFETPAEPALDENAGIAEPGGMDFVQGLDQDSGQDEFAQPEAEGNDSAQDEFAEPDLSSQDPDGATRLLKGLNHQMKPVLDFPDSGNSSFSKTRRLRASTSRSRRPERSIC